MELPGEVTVHSEPDLPDGLFANSNLIAETIFNLISERINRHRNTLPSEQLTRGTSLDPHLRMRYFHSAVTL